MTSTNLRLPDALPYPIVITAIASPPNSQVSRGTPLLHYSFDFTPKRPPPADPTQKPQPPQSERRFGTWESPVDGVIESVAVRPGTRLSQQDAKAKHALTIVEECSHPMQISGLCAICGKDTTITDYIGISDESRASIRMTHDAAGPTVSQAEAQRIEHETANRLLDNRKLILIVDLDQTIVHATVDPTVGEWIAQGQAYEQRKSAREAKAHARAEKHLLKADHQDGEARGAESSDSDDDADDTEKEGEVNPNWEMLKDVARFKLGPEATSGHRNKGRTVETALHDEGCDYYIKPRPGLEMFLSRLKERYEMHVYTMGTRAYALKVCNAIDPTGDLFNQRILTRDESGSMTQKSIERLFPYNNRMVVIIDDRADVWQYSPNLVKVVPYDFFVGIGDINAAYLPQSPDPLGTTSATKAPSSIPLSSSRNVAPDFATPTLASSPHTASSSLSSTDPDSTKAEVESALVAEAQTKAVVTQLEERPLAKMQEALDATSEAEDKEPPAPEEAIPAISLSNGQANGVASAEKEKGVHHHKPLLTNDDWELERVWNILDEVHRRFFAAHDSKTQTGHLSNGKGKQTGTLNRSALVPDVKVIIPGMKAETLAGVHILFSSVIPLGMTPQRSDAWRYAHEFGAKCYTRLSDEITHVVSAKEGTEKVIKAFQRGTIKVVWAKWFQNCIALWKHLDESAEYLLPQPSKKTLENMEAAQTPSGNSVDNGKNEDADTPNGGLNLDAMVDTETPRGTDTPVDTGTPPVVELDLDWAAAHDDVEAFLNESSDEEDGDDDDQEEDENEKGGFGLDPREDAGNDVDERQMDALFAEDEESRDLAYGQSSGVSSSKDGRLKRRRSGSINSVSASDVDDVTPSAKRPKVAPGGSSSSDFVKIPEEDEDEDDDADEDEEMVAASKQTSSANSSADEDDEGIDEDNGHDDADGGEEASEEESEDEDFLSGLADEDGWG